MIVIRQRGLYPMAAKTRKTFKTLVVQKTKMKAHRLMEAKLYPLKTYRNQLLTLLVSQRQKRLQKKVTVRGLI